MASPTLLGTQNATLKEQDPELYAIIQAEWKRQKGCLEMIASENFTSRAVMECLGSCLTNKYSEGQVGNRYYGGNEHIDEVETLCKQRALAAFGLDPQVWGVNVQPYSGSPANFAVLTGLLNPHDRIMGLSLTHGGHLTHGYYTPKKKISATSIFFESLPYFTGENGLLDMKAIEESAKVYRPKMLITGASAYPRFWDWSQFRGICDRLGDTLLFADIAHIAGLVATGLHPSPFEYCDVVTSTTHKSLRGPRAGIIFYRLKDKDGKPTDFKEKIDFAVFPGLQGGPHNHQIAAVATQFREVASPEFKAYSEQVIANSKAFAEGCAKRGMSVHTGGTDNHLVMLNFRPNNITGSKIEKILDYVGITVNRNSLPGDTSALVPYGIRVGVGALTTRGMKEAEIDTVCGFFKEAFDIALTLQADGKATKIVDFCKLFDSHEGLKNLKERVSKFIAPWPMPGTEP